MVAVKEANKRTQKVHACTCGNTENLTRNYYYIGGKGYMPVGECQDCLKGRWEESTRAVEALRNKMNSKEEGVE